MKSILKRTGRTGKASYESSSFIALCQVFARVLIFARDHTWCGCISMIRILQGDYGAYYASTLGCCCINDRNAERRSVVLVGPDERFPPPIVVKGRVTRALVKGKTTRGRVNHIQIQKQSSPQPRHSPRGHLNKSIT